MDVPFEQMSGFKVLPGVEPRLTYYRFSSHFNRLSYLGVWRSEEPFAIPKMMYHGFRICSFISLSIAMTLQLMDFYFALGNFRKISFNICTTGIQIGVLIKLIIYYNKRNLLYDLRLGLWKDSLENDSSDLVEIYDAAYEKLHKIQRLYYTSLGFFLPFGIVCSYFSYLWGPRQLAFAAYFPMEDPMDDSFFFPALAEEAAAAFYIMLIVMETELSTFSVMLQLEASHQALSRNFLKLSKIFEEAEDLDVNPTEEVNLPLRKENGRRQMKSLVVQHLKILRLMKAFGEIYNPCMLLQVVSGCILLVVNGVEITMTEGESMKVIYQCGYTIMIMVDLFFVCLLITRLTTEGMGVGEAAYSTTWYNMDPELKKSIQLVMNRCQMPPVVTVGKFSEAGLNTYLNMLSDTYSWLMLFRQLAGK